MRNAKAVQTKSKAHQVTQQTATTYQVTSGTSGQTYTVTLQNQGAVCNCDWGKYRPRQDPRSGCSHAMAVYTHIGHWTGRRMSAWSSEADAKRQRRPQLGIGDGITLTSRKSDSAPILVNWPTGQVAVLEIV